MDTCPTLDFEWLGLRTTRTVVVADMVESSRLFETEELQTIARWVRLIERVKADILPALGGTIIRSLGDGLLLEFQEPRAAIDAAFAIQQLCRQLNAGVSAGSHIVLRIGIETGGVLITEHDVFGNSINLATRLCTLAGPGEIVVSAGVREQITATLDADIEDLGECYLKHLRNPIRAYRVGPPGSQPVIDARVSFGDLRPAIAVVPFATRDGSQSNHLVGEVLAEEIIQELAASQDLNVISRLSTAAFSSRDATPGDIAAHLRVQYVVSGTYITDDASIRVTAELTEARSGHIVWAGSARGRLEHIVHGDREIVLGIAADVRKGVLARELQRARTQPLPTLQSYTLLIAAIGLMHRMSVRDFEQAHHLLDAVIDRARRQALPHAWLAQWFVLRVQQGWSPDRGKDAQQALDSSKRALDADPDCSLALAVDGLVNTHFLKRLDVARARYHLAVENNPNDALAWVLKGTMHAFMAEGREAVSNTRRALALSPLDPHLYYYESLAGTACLSAKDYEGALRHAHRSLRANCTHTSTLRVATIAAWRLARHDDARLMARKLLALEPGLTIRRYMARTPAAPFETGNDWSDALRQAGIPD